MIRSTVPLDAASHEFSSSLSFRALDVEDGKRLGRLLYAAYRGTIDDEGQSLEEAWEEALETLQGKYGHVIWSASFLAFADTGAAVSCSVVTETEKFGPLLAFAATDPNYQKQGLAGRLIGMSLDALHAVEIDQVALVVTDGNEPAISLYRKLGFVARPLEPEQPV